MAFSLTMAGCASIVNGDHQKVTVMSKPSHARLSVDNIDVGVTPKQINLLRKNEHVIKLDLAGYQTTSIPWQKTVSGWFFDNIFIGGLIGIAVDALDGAMYKLTPAQMSDYAAKAKIHYTAKTHTLMVILVEKADKNWQKIGKLKKIAR